MDLHSTQSTMDVFKPNVSHPPFWCKAHSPVLFHYIHHQDEDEDDDGDDNDNPSSFYHYPLRFMGPTRTESSNHRANPIVSPNNPPRPPNAWILYRSDKLKDLPPPPPGMPRRPQADISKAISVMWKTESPEVRARYERLSDIKKAEHQAAYPGYRFQPMKKADKDRLRAEKLAEKERERGTRKTRARTRVPAGQEPPPLYTTQARFGPAGPSPPASAASTPPVSQSSTQQQPATPSHPTPPTDLPTPPPTHAPSPPLPSSSASPYPPPPTMTSIPPLVAPQAGVPQRPPSPSAWQPQDPHSSQPQPPEQELNALWLDQGSFLDLSQYPGSQEYMNLPVSTTSPQNPLGWTPEDPSPLPDTSLYRADPLQAVLFPTTDPNIFNFNGDFDVAELFDGAREIEISMGPELALPQFGSSDLNQLAVFNSLFANMCSPSQVASSSDPSSAETPGQPSLSSDIAGGSTSSSAIDGLAPYFFESMIDGRTPEHEVGNGTTASEFQWLEGPIATSQEALPSAPERYVPPSGAANSSTRRVAADWRYIQLTPEPETAAPDVRNNH